MKLTTKMKLQLSAMLILIIVMSLLIGLTPVINKKKISEHFYDYIKNDRIKNLVIKDANGKIIYDGGFSDNKKTRLSTFHLVGDLSGSLPSSLLTTYLSNDASISVLDGYHSEQHTINLTIDLDLQKAAYDLLTSYGVNGTVFVADYNTGAIKAMVSTPSVDVKSKKEPADKAYLNKAAQAYTPGSVFKSIAIGALLEKSQSYQSLTYTCNGKYEKVSCSSAHGAVTLEEALYKSCNCGVAKCVSEHLSAEELDAFAKKAGVTSTNLIVDYPIKAGVIDASDDIRWSSDGQSKDLVTPVTIASYYGAIANNGRRKQFYYQQSNANTSTKRIMEFRTSLFLQTALTKGMTNWYSTRFNCSCFGKTGTAETGRGTDHSWFVCSLTDSNAPNYVIVIMLEEGGSSTNAIKMTARFVNNTILGG